MAKREILAGATDQTIDVFILDSSSSIGAGLTGLVYNTASLVCYYRKGATGTPTALTLATQTVGGAHSDGGFVAVDGTNCPGQYRLDLSDTIVATAGMVTVYLRGATNMAPCVIEIEVVSVNKFDGTRMGLTALPNAAADAAGGLVISDAGGFDIDNRAPAAAAVTNLNTVFNTDFAANYNTTLDKWNVNTTHLAGTANTGRDIGASVLLSSGTGTGQININTGRVDSNIVRVLNGADAATGLSLAGADYFTYGYFASNIIALSGGFNEATNLLHAYQNGADSGWGPILHTTTVKTVNSQTDIYLDSGAAENDAYNGCFVVIRSALALDSAKPMRVSDYAVTSEKQLILASAPGFTIAIGDIIQILAADVPASAPTVGDIADAVWDEATSGHTTSGTFGEQVKTDIDAILVDTAEIGAAGAGLTALAQASIWTSTIAGRIDVATSTRASQTSVDTIDGIVDDILVDTGTDIPATLSTIAGYIDTEISALTTAVGVVDGIVDSILEDTGTTLPATLTGIMGATFNSSTDSLEALRDRGDAAWITVTAGAIRSAVGLASANLDTQLGDVPTVSEFNARTIVSADYATVANQTAIVEDTGTTLPAQIAALNNVSTAQVQTAAAAALTAYDPPTNAEMLAAHSTTDGLITTVDTVVDAIKLKTDLIPASPAAVGSLMGLTDGAITDAKFTIPTLTGPASGPVGFITQLWRRFFKKATKSATEIKTYADDGTTVITTQAISAVDDDETQGAAS